MNNKKKSFFAVCATVLVMLLIFAFSSHNAAESTGQSVKITRYICRVIFFRFKNMTSEQQAFIVTELNHFVRKLAHFSIYMLLGVCSYSSLLLSEFNIKKKWVTALEICMAYAVLDEIHQYFIPGRAMSAVDVCIDSAGALIGIIIVRVIVIIFTYMIAYRKENKMHSGSSRGGKVMD